MSSESIQHFFYEKALEMWREIPAKEKGSEGDVTKTFLRKILNLATVREYEEFKLRLAYHVARNSKARADDVIKFYRKLVGLAENAPIDKDMNKLRNFIEYLIMSHIAKAKEMM